MTVAAPTSVGAHVEAVTLWSKNDFVNGLYSRLAVILGCFALSFAATKITSSIRKQVAALAIASQTTLEQPLPAATVLPQSALRRKAFRLTTSVIL
jgi:hypothetical protein